MQQRRFLDTPAALASAVRGGRAAAGITQAQLARRAGVDALFVADLESEQPCSELGDVIAVLTAVGIHATALPPPPITKTLHEVDLDQVILRHL